MADGAANIRRRIFGQIAGQKADGQPVDAMRFADTRVAVSPADMCTTLVELLRGKC
jgi:hypothetical protein